GGFGSFLVFVPQIFVLTFIVGILEDSGYLARAAIICHRPLSWFGLSGKSFVPLLSGHACAIPAIMAARTIDSPKRRLLTQMVVPLMACSARLPVYSLFIAALIPSTTFLGGLIGYQGLAFFGIYAFSILVALIVSGITSKTLFKKESDSPFVLELPPYRLPHWKPLLTRALSSAWKFITKAGAIIFTVTMVIWFLGYFPDGDGSLSTSYLSVIGKFVSPIFEPLGVDWKFSVAILTSFLAREVFVGTLGTLFGIEGADEDVTGLSDQLTSSGFSLASGFALLVFYAIAMQCVSTLAVMKKEMGGYRYPLIALTLYSVLAYVLAVVTYKILV
ncbi:MAG: ferrous iron transporter B, partial [Bdellovibrionales bacterium]|nr:ferrous iron transporter B [Bdellovibrionales bacterium]